MDRFSAKFAHMRSPRRARARAQPRLSKKIKVWISRAHFGNAYGSDAGLRCCKASVSTHPNVVPYCFVVAAAGSISVSWAQIYEKVEAPQILADDQYPGSSEILRVSSHVNPLAQFRSPRAHKNITEWVWKLAERDLTKAELLRDMDNLNLKQWTRLIRLQRRDWIKEKNASLGSF